MRCKRCSCTTDQPCTGSCAWALPDLCSACLTLDETRLAAQYADRLDHLRVEMVEAAVERRFLAILTGLLANPIHATTAPEALLMRAAQIAQALRWAFDAEPS